MSDTDLSERLEAAGVRPTRQRLALARLLFAGDRHVTAEQLHREAEESGEAVSLATVYNTLNHFRDMGLLREIAVSPGITWFDTNLSPHFHLYDESCERLSDLPQDAASLSLPQLPEGLVLSRVDVIIRVTSA